MKIRDMEEEQIIAVVEKAIALLYEARTISQEGIHFHKRRHIYDDGPGKKPDEKGMPPIPYYSELSAREQRIYEQGQFNGIARMAGQVVLQLKPVLEEYEGLSDFGLDGMTPLTA